MRFDNPELQAKIKQQWVSDTGRSPEELVEDAVAGYFDELASVRKTLDSRYDEVKNGNVKLMDGEEAFACLKAKSEAWRNSRR